VAQLMERLALQPRARPHLFEEAACAPRVDDRTRVADEHVASRSRSRACRTRSNTARRSARIRPDRRHDPPGHLRPVQPENLPGRAQPGRRRLPVRHGRTSGGTVPGQGRRSTSTICRSVSTLPRRAVSAGASCHFRAKPLKSWPTTLRSARAFSPAAVAADYSQVLRAG
jgi:hypothetical protein